MTDNKENLIAWLRDAHAMEGQAIESIGLQLRRLTDYPELEARLRAHLDETRGHQRKVLECLHRLGADPSLLKAGMARLTGTVQGLAQRLTGDDVLKSCLGNYAFEHFEIASYKMLIAAADHLDDQATANACREILAEEQAMAEWLDDHLGELTRAYMTRAVADQAAAP